MKYLAEFTWETQSEIKLPRLPEKISADKIFEGK